MCRLKKVNGYYLNGKPITMAEIRRRQLVDEDTIHYALKYDLLEIPLTGNNYLEIDVTYYAGADNY